MNNTNLYCVRFTLICICAQREFECIRFVITEWPLKISLTMARRYQPSCVDERLWPFGSGAVDDALARLFFFFSSRVVAAVPFQVFVLLFLHALSFAFWFCSRPPSTVVFVHHASAVSSREIPCSGPQRPSSINRVCGPRRHEPAVVHGSAEYVIGLDRQSAPASRIRVTPVVCPRLLVVKYLYTFFIL